QKDPAIRALDSEPIISQTAENVWVTKIGTVHPDQMYIVSGDLDGHGYNQAANDNGSGAALAMELARAFASPDVTTDVSIRFVLWNGEEEGLLGARAYVEQRAALQGKEDPAGSHKYPEPTWLGMVHHDMMMWDHGMPRADGSVSPDQRPEADVNIEFQSISKTADASRKLAWAFKAANEMYATDYPAQVGPHMTNTCSSAFMDVTPSISLRENERGAQIGAGWDPNWHQASDVFTTYSDEDFRLGLNAAQTTLSAIAELTGAKLKTEQGEEGSR
ncbi:MAG TPA: M28 family peptidase, partial [Gemmatimonadaceae bacterium]